MLECKNFCTRAMFRPQHTSSAKSSPKKSVQPEQCSQYTDLAAGWTIQSTNSSKGQQVSLFSKMPRPNLGHTQPPVQWVSGLLPGHDFDHYSPPSAKTECSYTSICHTCLRGMGRENIIFYKVSKLVKAVIRLICLGGYLVQIPAKILTMPRFYKVFLSPSKQLQDSTLNLVKAASFHVLSN